MMSHAQLAQSAVDRLTAGAHALIIEGPSYRQRTHPIGTAGIDSKSEAHNAPSHFQGRRMLVAMRWSRHAARDHPRTGARRHPPGRGQRVAPSGHLVSACRLADVRGR
jgi:hypothetical protein